MSRGAALRVVSLFSGVGGTDLGFEEAGHRTVLLCEKSPAAQAVLRYRFPQAPLISDVADVARAAPERFDVLTAGFPCQDLSPAGACAGVGGSRSSLVTHVFRMIEGRPRSRRPTWVVLENVPFLLSLDSGRAMDYVGRVLSLLGYSWAYRVVDTFAFGLPQYRPRWVFVACLEGRGDPRSVLMHGNHPMPPRIRGAGWLEGRACGFSWSEGTRGIGWSDDGVPTIRVGSGRGIPTPPAVILPSGEIVTPTLRDLESLQGFPRGWTSPAATRARWRLVGNAAPVPVFCWVGKRLNADANSNVPEGVEIPAGGKWPRAAWQASCREPRYGIPGQSTHPVATPRPPLACVLQEEGGQPYLSARATEGFLARFERGSLFAKNRPGIRTEIIRALRGHLRRKPVNPLA